MRWLATDHIRPPAGKLWLIHHTMYNRNFPIRIVTKICIPRWFKWLFWCCAGLGGGCLRCRVCRPKWRDWHWPACWFTCFLKQDGVYYPVLNVLNIVEAVLNVWSGLNNPPRKSPEQGKLAILRFKNFTFVRTSEVISALTYRVLLGWG